MQTPNEFWLALHTLAEAYAMEGSTAEERMVNIVGELRQLPPAARRSVLAELGQLAAHSSDLYIASLLAAREEDERDLRGQRVAG